MPAMHHFQCPVCNRIEYDVLCTNGHFHKPCVCGARMDILWRWESRPVCVHPSERAVVWYNPQTGKHATPGRNDVEMPQRYKDAGYQRREFATLHDLDRYCKQEGLHNEKADFDNSGHADDL
jgi:hypothetical protein